MPANKVLIVEDDDAVRRSFSLYLKHKGYAVDGAGDGLEGLQKLAAGSYDIVVSDIMMPNMNGIQFLEQLKKDDPTIPVIMITGYADLQNAIDSMKKGAVDFITKPFQYDEVEKTLRNLLSAKDLNAEVSTQSLYNRLERKILDLSVIYSINEVLDNISDIDELFEHITELACKITEATSSAFYLCDRDAHVYFLKDVYSTIKGESRPTSFKLENEIHEAINLEQSPLIYTDPEELTLFADMAPEHRQYRSLMLIPLFVRGEDFGILALEDKKTGDTFEDADGTFVTILLKKASLIIENRALYETIYNNMVRTLRSLVTTLEAKDNYTQRHSERVTQISLMIANEIKCSKEEMEIIQFASMLHDIGKIGISDAILQKKGRLTDEEFEEIKKHPVVGEKILEPLGMMPHEKAIIRYHHERWDGRGYPDGLAGRDIPFLARIVSLADAYDAMTSDRVYRRALSHAKAMAEIERNAWLQFDGNLVKAFFKLCERSGDEVVAKEN